MGEVRCACGGWEHGRERALIQFARKLGQNSRSSEEVVISALLLQTHQHSRHVLK